MARTRRKKRRTHVAEDVDASIPRTFVMKRGKVGRSVQQLMLDFRRIMEPHTASNLRVRKRNVLKDFVHVAGQLGVTHFVIFSRTEGGPNMRVARLPRGPTLSFKVEEYTTIQDVIRLQKKPRVADALFNDAPLLVLNNFGGKQQEMQLMTTVFQNMFPSINIHEVKLADIRRVLLMNYDADTQRVEVRHYCISVQPTGLSKSIKKLVVHSKIPDLRDVDDISEYVLKGAFGSDSEGEDAAASHVTIPQKVGKLQKATQTAIKLSEIGPRLALSLVKIEDGMCAGEVLFHSHIQRSEEEIESLRKKRKAQEKLKAKRRKEQEANVERKKKEEEDHRKLTGKRKNEEDELDSDVEGDIELYRQEVGEDPDADLFNRNKRKRSHKGGDDKRGNSKRVRPDDKSKGVRFAGAGGAKGGKGDQRSAKVPHAKSPSGAKKGIAVAKQKTTGKVFNRRRNK